MAKLVLVRHGQSIWNLENRFTGWVDISLSSKGIKEANKAGEKLKDMKFSIAFTSELYRAQETLFKILEKHSKFSKFMILRSKMSWKYNKFTKRKEDDGVLPIVKAEALNERHYGKLQGLNKDETREKYGEEQVHIWRRSYDVAPPGGESLKDTSKRTLPYYKKRILKELKRGNNVLVVAHGNSLRALVKYIEDISKEDITGYEIKTGVPYVYHFNKDLKVTKKEVLE